MGETQADDPRGGHCVMARAEVLPREAGLPPQNAALKPALLVAMAGLHGRSSMHTLRRACRTGDEPVLHHLLRYELGPSLSGVKIGRDDRNPLHIAIDGRCAGTSFIRELLGAGVHPAAIDAVSSKTPEWTATAGGRAGLAPARGGLS